MTHACASSTIIDVSAKCSDLCIVQYANGKPESDGYVPSDLGIGGGDYVEFKLCTNCGFIIDEWPKPIPEGEDR